jgi:hypothetical protein
VRDDNPVAALDQVRHAAGRLYDRGILIRNAHVPRIGDERIPSDCDDDGSQVSGSRDSPRFERIGQTNKGEPAMPGH